jgi:uncharacterized protein YjbI with pentapeptide repeats
VAKQQYAAGNAILSPYDLKAVMESTLYGLPMYHLNTNGTPAAPESGPTTYTDPVTGLTAANVSLSFKNGSAPGQLSIVSTPNGEYYQVNATAGSPPGIQATEYRPIEPLATVPVTEAGLVPHGALITSLESTDTGDFTPAYSTPSAGSAGSTPPSIGDAAFPGTLQRVATYGTFTSTGTGQGAQLDFIDGQFFPDPSDSGTGTQRIFNSMSAQVLYDQSGSPLADDYTPATIDTSDAYTSDGSANFSVQVTPSSSNDPVAEVTVLYTDADHPSTWNSVALSSSDGMNWSGSVSETSGDQVQYIVEAVDSAGNVAVSNNEGADFDGNAAPAITISLSGGTPVNGYYTGSVTAAITAPGDSTYVLDGAAPDPVPSDGEVVVSAAGDHDITVSDPAGDSATQSFAISTSQSETSIYSYSNPATVGSEFDIFADVNPATSGSGTPTGDVEFLDDGTPVPGCGGSSGTSLDDGIAYCTLDYPTPGTHQLVGVYSGDSNFSGSSSAAMAQAVIDLDTTTSLSTSANPVTANKPVTFKVTVGTPAQGYRNPTGNVEFLEESTPIASCGGAGGKALNGSSQAICKLTQKKPGDYTISAIYLGSGAWVASNSTSLSEIVTHSQCKTFSRCDLSGLDLAGANLAKVNLSGANLSGANLSGTNLSGANLSGADLERANLTGASAVSVYMARANLIHANLTRANFSDANLSYADLDGAKITGTNFTGGDRKGAKS